MYPKLLLFLLAFVSFSCINTEPTLMELPPPSDEDPVEVAEMNTPPAFDILVFSKTTGYRHQSIETGIAAIKVLGEKHNFDVFATEESDIFTSDLMSRYEAVVFLNTSGENILTEEEKQAFKNYIQQGGVLLAYMALLLRDMNGPGMGS